MLLILSSLAAAALTPRLPQKIVRHPRLPVWPAWQGLALGVLSLAPPLRKPCDLLEDAFGGRVCPIQFEDADPFILLVHHRHAFRPLDILRPLFSAVIMPEGFPAHPHRGFETVTYVLPGRAGLIHRDSEGCKMRYGDGAVQWMTAGRGMLHEEMWDVEAKGGDAELYQLWVNLPPHAKFESPRVQLLTPREASIAEVEREGTTPVRRALIGQRELQSGAVTVRTLACAPVDGTPESEVGAQTYSPMCIEHVELRGVDSSYTLPLPDGWTCIVYVRRGRVSCGGQPIGNQPLAADSAAMPDSAVAEMHETVYMNRRGGDCLVLSNAHAGMSDVLVLAGEPIGAPVVASGTMVMNSQAEVNTALADYSRGDFGLPWDHTLADDEWSEQCARASRARQGGSLSG